MRLLPFKRFGFLCPQIYTLFSNAQYFWSIFFVRHYFDIQELMVI